MVNFHSMQKKKNQNVENFIRYNFYLKHFLLKFIVKELLKKKQISDLLLLI